MSPINEKFKGIIFDVDGTLTSSNELIHQSFNYISLKYRGKTFSWDEIKTLFGPTESQIIQMTIPDRFNEAEADYFDFYASNHSLAGLYDGMKELLIELRKAGRKLGVFTGKGRRSTMISLELLEISTFFDVIITGDDVIYQKPSGEGITRCVTAMGLTPADVLMVGDAAADIQAAWDAGVPIASVLWDCYAREAVLAMKSNYYFESVQSLKGFLL